MNKILALVLIAILPSCSLFHKTPQSVVDGQRGAYQGVLSLEDNIRVLLEAYERDNKAAVVYHINYVFEPKIQAIRLKPELTKEEKSREITKLEEQRDAAISDAFREIEKNVKELGQAPEKNVRLTKMIIESVYNYMSTSPITIDNISFWIKKLEQVNSN